MIIDNIPAGLETGFLRETEADTMPVLRREGAAIIYPALIRHDSRGYHYFEVPVPYTGQPLDDAGAFAIASYAALRAYFYGPVTVQLEQQLKGTFARHQYAVRSTFPKVVGEGNQNGRNLDELFSSEA